MFNIETQPALPLTIAEDYTAQTADGSQVVLTKDSLLEIAAIDPANCNVRINHTVFTNGTSNKNTYLIPNSEFDGIKFMLPPSPQYLQSICTYTVLAAASNGKAEAEAVMELWKTLRTLKQKKAYLNDFAHRIVNRHSNSYGKAYDVMNHLFVQLSQEVMERKNEKRKKRSIKDK